MSLEVGNTTRNCWYQFYHAFNEEYFIGMTHVAPRIVNNVSGVKRINDECYFSWQAQYLVKFKCHFSWQAQYSVKFGMIAGARNVVFFNTKCSWWA